MSIRFLNKLYLCIIWPYNIFCYKAFFYEEMKNYLKILLYKYNKMEYSREDYENNKNAYFERGDGIYLSKKEFKENKYLKKELENFFGLLLF